MDGTTVSQKIHIGCSGWMYKEWRIFYPDGLPQKCWFEREPTHDPAMILADMRSMMRGR